MTVVVAKKQNGQITFAADSIQVLGHGVIVTDRSIAVNKLFQHNGLTIGTTGSSGEGSLMFLFSRNHRPVAPTFEAVMDFLLEFDAWARGKDKSFSGHNEYLLAYDGELFRCFTMLDVFKVEEFDAIGAGADFAKTALHLNHSPYEAVEIACQLSVFCNLPVKELTA
jgi:ATP-dependent protease HslVU (ClpYQ) peptidase subunit